MTYLKQNKKKPDACQSFPVREAEAYTGRVCRGWTAVQHKQRYDYTPHARSRPPWPSHTNREGESEVDEGGASRSEQQRDDYAGYLVYDGRMDGFKQDGAGGLREAKNTTSTESEERVNCNVVEQDEERACRAEAAGVG